MHGLMVAAAFAFSLPSVAPLEIPDATVVVPGIHLGPVHRDPRDMPFRHSAGCAVVFEGDRQVAWHGPVQTPRVEEFALQNFGPETTVFAWKAVYRQVGQPCDGIKRIGPAPRDKR